MNHATLYKRTKTGAIQYYRVSVMSEEGKSVAIIVKESGQLGTTSPIFHREPITEGKNPGRSNETTAQQQAELQAASDWKRKKDEGYKSLDDLNISRVPNPGVNTDHVWRRVEGVTTIPFFGTLPACLQEALPQFNTDAGGNVKPMLATDWKKIRKIDYPVYVQPKLDGIRCLLIVDYHYEISSFSIQFLSRAGKPFTTLGHIEAEVQRYLDSQIRMEMNGEGEAPYSFILDGELYSDELTFQEITQAVKKRYPNTARIHFRAYDVVSDQTWEARMEQARRLVEEIKSPNITYVPTLIAASAEVVKQLHDAWFKEGFEGAMIRLPQGKYAQGQRSRELLKVKEFNEAEFTIVGGKLYKVPLPPTGAMECSDRDADSFTFTCTTQTGGTFDVKPMGTRGERGDYVLNLANHIGRKYTVKYFGLTDDGLPRFPIGKAVRDYE